MPILLISILIGSLFSRPLINQELPSIPKSTVQAEEIAPLNIEAQGMYVAEVGKTDQPVIEYRKDETWSIASLTKIMTALVLLEQNLNLEKYVAIEKNDFVGGATLEVPVGTKMKLIDLLHASLMSSANNATNALVHGTGLSYEAFVQKMNDRARTLGLKNTRFVELTGLDPENKSTPEEYAKIITEALAHPQIAEIMTKTYHRIDPKNYGVFAIGSTNKLLKESNDFEVVGGKTGFTDGSDYNFAAQVKKGDKQLVVVVFGDKTFNGAFEDSKKLAEEALDNPGE